MSGKIRIVRVLNNPRKAKRRRKNTRPTKRARRRGSARRRAPRAAKQHFFVQGCKSGRLSYLSPRGLFRNRGHGEKFATIKLAEAALRSHAAKAKKQGFNWLQIVPA